MDGPADSPSVSPPIAAKRWQRVWRKKLRFAICPCPPELALYRAFRAAGRRGQICPRQICKTSRAAWCDYDSTAPVTAKLAGDTAAEVMTLCAIGMAIAGIDTRHDRSLAIR